MHQGLKVAITKILNATWQRCRVHFMRNALAYAGKTQQTEEFLRTAYHDVIPEIRDYWMPQRPRKPTVKPDLT